MVEGRQCFVVYPLIEESEKVDLEAAKSGFEKLKQIFKDFEEDPFESPMPLFIAFSSAKDSSWDERYPGYSRAH